MISFTLQITTSPNSYAIYNSFTNWQHTSDEYHKNITDQNNTQRRVRIISTDTNRFNIPQTYGESLYLARSDRTVTKTRCHSTEDALTMKQSLKRTLSLLLQYTDSYFLNHFLHISDPRDVDQLSAIIIENQYKWTNITFHINGEKDVCNN